MTVTTGTLRRSQYYDGDPDSRVCPHRERKNKKSTTGCGLDTCRFEGIRQDAVANGRFKRGRGWFKYRV